MNDNSINNLEENKEVVFKLKGVIRDLKDKNLSKIYSDCQTSLNKNDKLMFKFHMTGLLASLLNKIEQNKISKTDSLRLNEITEKYKTLSKLSKM